MVDSFLQFLYAFGATISFSVLFNVKKKHLFACGVVGGIGWVLYWVLEKGGYSEVFATFIATLALSTISYFLAKRKKAPVTVFLISGIIPLVPGVTLYRTMYYLLFSEYDLALSYALLTLQLAGVIASGMILSALFPVLIRPKEVYKKRL